MNRETPIMLDLEDPIIRALGVTAALHGCTEENLSLGGMSGAHQVLYDELRKIQRLYYAIHDAEREPAGTVDSVKDEVGYMRAVNTLECLADSLTSKGGEPVCPAEVSNVIELALAELKRSVVL